MRQLPCPHCFERPSSLDMHLRFECPKLIGRSRYVEPGTLTNEQSAEFHAEIEQFLLTSEA